MSILLDFILDGIVTQDMGFEEECGVTKTRLQDQIIPVPICL